MSTVAIANQKGGCGRTTIVVNLAAALTRLDRRVLVLDLDPQCHSTVYLLPDDGRTRLTTFDLLNPDTHERNVSLDDVTIQAGEGLFLAPGCGLLRDLEKHLLCRPDSMGLLENKIENGGSTWDEILIDCPPNLGPLTESALLSANEVLVPVDPSPFSIQSARNLDEKVENLHKGRKHRPRLAFIPNQIQPRSRQHQRFMQTLEATFEGRVSANRIRRSILVVEAAMNRKSLFELARRSTVAEDFENLAMELIRPEPRGTARAVAVEFSLIHPEAREVKVAGSFNNWSPRPMEPQKKGENSDWKASLLLEPGEYEYQFIVDGNWKPDPKNPEAVNSPFGGKNSLLHVRGKGEIETEKGKKE